MGIKPGETVIDDGNFIQMAIAIPPGQSRGRIPRDYNRVPYGSLPGAQPFDIPVIPRSDWSARIKEREERKALLSEVMTQGGVPSLNQDGTNYCWCNGVVTAMLALRALAGSPYVELSPASVAAPIKNYRNDGGWGGEALEYIVQHGVAEASTWPANAIDRKYDNDASQASRSKHVITEWYELAPRNFDQKMTLLLLGIPVASGYNWWSHETCGIDPVEIEAGHFGSRERNSWGDQPPKYPEGWFVLAESKANADDAVAPRVSMA